jgi:hypothetical protein
MWTNSSLIVGLQVERSETRRSHTFASLQRKLRRTVDAHQTKQRADRKKHSPLSDYDRTISKSIQAEKKKEKMAWMGVAQLGNKHSNQCHHCWLGINMVQT